MHALRRLDDPSPESPGSLGIPILLLTTTGARSGLPRANPLIYARDGDALLVVGSNFGQTRHPAWTTNVLANPNVKVTLGGETVPATATQLIDGEADAAYAKLIEVTRTYREYQARTDRAIRVFRLSATLHPDTTG